MDCLPWLRNNYVVDVWEIRKHMIVTQDPVCNSMLGLHLGRLRPLPWVRGQWQWCYGSNMSIIINNNNK